MRLFVLLGGLGLIFGPVSWARAQGTPADDKYLLEQLLAADTNKDGKLTLEEVDGISGVPLFLVLDANKDRVVTLDEVRENLHIFLERRKAAPPDWPPKPSQGLVPLTDLKMGTYKGKEGGLYPGGKNERPAVLRVRREAARRTRAPTARSRLARHLADGPPSAYPIKTSVKLADSVQMYR